MSTETKTHFLNLVHQVFDPVFDKYGFTIEDEAKWLEPETAIFAQKGDIKLGFRLGVINHVYYFSLEIHLSGALGEKATSDPEARGLGVAAIARCLDPNYKINLKDSRSEDELREKMESDRGELVKYCEDILLGDVSNWQKVVDCLNDKSRK
jgi:hypothetical protein